MPDPMMHISASSVKRPSLPSFARGFAPGVSIQKERVGLGTGRLAGPCFVGNSRTVCMLSN